MAETKIEWTSTPRPDGTLAPGYTFNGWIGCTEDEDEPGEMSPECANCYAREGQNHRVSKAKALPLWGPEASRQVTTTGYWRKPLAWDREAAAEGVRIKVFCQSLSDVCEDFRGSLVGDTRGGTWRTLDDARAALWRLIEATPHLDWLVLTKRPQNVLRMVPRGWHMKSGGFEPHLWPRNVWVGTTAGTQRGADRRCPELVKIPAPVLFVSYEPALELVDFSRWLGRQCQVRGIWGHGPIGCSNEEHYAPGIGWLIFGGESGRGARGCEVEWARKTRDACKRASVPLFCKQLGELPLGGDVHQGRWVLHLRGKGGDMAEWAPDLRVREYPVPVHR